MTTSTDLPDWAARLPDWVLDDEVRWLSKRPWIGGFIEPADYSLNPAILRFKESQRRLGVANRSTDTPTELITVRGHETTALRFTTATKTGVTRHVKIHSPDASRIRGLAVPYGEKSWPVQVAGIIAIEQFDRNSFDPLPPSAPLRIDHDYSRTLGRVTSLRHTTDGLAIEAEINEADRATWIRRWVSGEYSSLSIAFAGAPIFDDWTSSGAYPLRTVRHAQLVEVSVVRDPAYGSARITEVTT